jgi:arylsulfatase
VIRWPGRIPAAQVSNDIVHEVDLFPTIAAAAGAPGIVDVRPDAVDFTREKRVGVAANPFQRIGR